MTSKQRKTATEEVSHGVTSIDVIVSRDDGFSWSVTVEGNGERSYHDVMRVIHASTIDLSKVSR